MVVAMGMLPEDHLVVPPSAVLSAVPLVVAPLVAPLVALLVVLLLVHALLVMHSMALMGKVLLVPLVVMGIVLDHTTLRFLPSSTSYRLAHLVRATSGHMP